MALPERIVVASANPKKAAELAALLADLPVEVVPRPPEVPEVVEDGDTFEANARLKAVALAAATGEVALADDSGLEVDALAGAPGVHSARYAGVSATDADNVALLLSELARSGMVDPGQRVARFRCVLVLRWPDGTEMVTDGAVEGHLSDAPAGDQGFGYDPVFVPVEGDGRTFAQMTGAEKQAISHRGRALRALVALLTD
jgi:XTP/dITP diphosphohydrolase